MHSLDFKFVIQIFFGGFLKTYWLHRGHFSKVVLTFEDLPKLSLTLNYDVIKVLKNYVSPPLPTTTTQQQPQKLGPLLDLAAIA